MKKIIKPFLLIISICLISSQLQSCAIAAVVAAVKYGNAKKMEAKAKCQQNYNNYLKVSKNPISLNKYCSE